MIDIRKEETFSLSRAAKLKALPRRRGSKHPAISTFYRWANQGVRGVKLETIRVGGTVCTSIEAIQRFFEALSQADKPLSKPPTRTATPKIVESTAGRGRLHWGSQQQIPRNRRVAAERSGLLKK